MVRKYRILKEGRSYFIFEGKPPGHVVEVPYRLPSPEKDPYPAQSLSSTDLVMAVLGMYYDNKDVIDISSEFDDKAVRTAKTLCAIINLERMPK
ncbi:MAG: hypothetical protein V1729_03075 [Candidatus Woesearchaeota archaeon]